MLRTHRTSARSSATARGAAAAFVLWLTFPLVSCNSGGGSGTTTPTVQVDPVQVTEGDSGEVTALFTLSLSAAASEAVTVEFRTEEGEAEAGLDYLDASGEVRIPAGGTSATVPVRVVGDLVDEPDETFSFEIVSATNARIDPDRRRVEGRVIDDDPTPSLRVEDASVAESYTGTETLVFRVLLSHPSSRTITVEFSTLDDTALAGEDYLATSGTLVFAAGEVEKSIEVTIVGDGSAEPDEKFRIELSSPTNARLERPRGEGTIVDRTDTVGLDERPSNSLCELLERPEATAAGLTTREAFPNFRVAGIAMFQAPNDNSQWYLIDAEGLVRTFENDPEVDTGHYFLDIRDRVHKTNDGGLLGLAFHPSYAINRQAFVYYTAPGDVWDVVHVSRFTSTDDGFSLDPSSEEIVLEIPQEEEFHKGGCMRFGTDGFLYISVGDGGISRRAQETDSLLGSMLRIGVDGAVPYAIPADNPFAGGGGRAEVYAWGLRNPWTWTFDRLNDDLWLGDVGASRWEEVDRIVKGGNYGWPVREGPICNREALCDDANDFVEPVVSFSHEQGNCVIGGFVYRGSAIPALYGTYLYADWGSGKIWALRYDENGKPAPEVVLEAGVTIYSFAEDQNGELYLVVKGRRVLAIVPAGDDVPRMPEQLSDVPCFEPGVPDTPVEGLIPYDVNIPFWSNGATKDRWIALPDDAQVHVNDDGSWEVPIGTVLVKHLSLGERLIETRLLVRHSDGDFGGYSYRWNEEGTDATLVPETITETIDGVEWSFPGRGQCFGCHTEAANRVLGFRPEQLNREFLYPSTGRVANQLATFDAIGLLDRRLVREPSELTAFPRLDDEAAPLDDRARAYLAVNCSHCHQPEHSIDVELDLRFETPLPETGLCGVPIRNDGDAASLRFIAAGDPESSVILQRVLALDESAMPPIGKSVVDDEGAALLEEWIMTLESCEEAP